MLSKTLFYYPGDNTQRRIGIKSGNNQIYWLFLGLLLAYAIHLLTDFISKENFYEFFPLGLKMRPEETKILQIPAIKSDEL